MVRRLFFAALWFVVIYFALGALVGAGAGMIAGVQNPENAGAAGAAAGQRAVEAFAGYIFAGALAFTGLGAWRGILPGTGPRAASARGASDGEDRLAGG